MEVVPWSAVSTNLRAPVFSQDSSRITRAFSPDLETVIIVHHPRQLHTFLFRKPVKMPATLLTGNGLTAMKSVARKLMRVLEDMADEKADSARNTAR